MVVQRILQAVVAPTEHPEIGRCGRVPGPWALVIARTRYLIPWRVTDNEARVLRVRLTSRRLPTHW